MAKNDPKKSAAGASALAAANDVYQGTFIGDLQGNADTATRLKDAFHLHLTGDATGTAVTDGTSASFDVTVLKAKSADDAKHAHVADTVGNALTADYASQAASADHALTADEAKHSINADFAKSATKAATAGSALTATNADEAKHAFEADHAVASDNAKSADVALKAYELINDPDKPVPEATHALVADRAEHATKADYDCLGRLIHTTYLTKDEGVSKDEAFDKEEADSLYAKKNEIVLQATIHGKASGYGHVVNQTLELFVTDLAMDSDGGPNLYGDIEFIESNDLPADPNTTKAYITKDQVMWLYNIDKDAWIDVRSRLSKEAEDKLDDALGKLSNYVDLTSDQDIHGGKAFWDPIFAPIPSFKDAPDHAVAVIHNLRDLYQRLKCMINSGDSALKDLIEKIEDRLEALENAFYGITNLGDVYIAYKDLTQSANTVDMITGAVYIGYLEEDKTFIPLNPDDFSQINPDQVPYWERHFIKDSNGIVTWKDIRFVGKQTNLSYKYLDHVPTEEESENFEVDTWYYFPAEASQDGPQGGGTVNGEFDLIQFLEDDDVNAHEPQTGELNIYGLGKEKTPSLPPEIAELSEFEKIHFYENEKPETGSAYAGEFNIYGLGSYGSGDDGMPLVGDLEFSKMNFLENETPESNEPQCGELNILGVGPATQTAAAAAVSPKSGSDLPPAKGDFRKMQFLENADAKGSKADTGEFNIYGLGKVTESE